MRSILRGNHCQTCEGNGARGFMLERDTPAKRLRPRQHACRRPVPKMRPVLRIGRSRTRHEYRDKLCRVGSTCRAENPPVSASTPISLIRYPLRLSDLKMRTELGPIGGHSAPLVLLHEG
jgi:hypothetical protein